MYTKETQSVPIKKKSAFQFILFLSPRKLHKFRTWKHQCSQSILNTMKQRLFRIPNLLVTSNTFIIFYLICGLSLLCITIHADTISLSGNKTYNGLFTGFKNDRFHFQPEDKKEIKKRRLGVISLIIEPPALVSVKQRGKKQNQEMRLKGYRKSNFLFIKNGKPLKLRGSVVRFIKMRIDFNRTFEKPGIFMTPHEQENFNIKDIIKQGTVTIIHFHMQSIMSSVRQGNYIRETAKRSKGKIKLVRIDISGWNDPIIEKYKLITLPQFWFYNRRGKFTGKLIDRFTSEDIDKAIKKASH